MIWPLKKRKPPEPTLCPVCKKPMVRDPSFDRIISWYCGGCDRNISQSDINKKSEWARVNKV